MMKYYVQSYTVQWCLKCWLQQSDFSARWWKYEEASFKWSHTGRGGSHTRRGGPPPAHWRPPLTPPPRGVGLHAWCAETNFPAGINQAQQAAASAQQHCCFASSLAWEIPAVTAMIHPQPPPSPLSVFWTIAVFGDVVSNYGVAIGRGRGETLGK